MNRNRKAGPVYIDPGHHIRRTSMMTVDTIAENDIEPVDHVIDVITLKGNHISGYQLSEPPALKGERHLVRNARIKRI